MQSQSDDIEALNLLIGFQLAEGQFQEACVSLQQLIAWQPDVAEHYQTLGSLWLQLGELNAAIACVQTAVQLNPYDTQWLNELLTQLNQQQQFETVIRLAIAALQVFPIWDQGFLHIGYALQHQNGPTDVIEACSTGYLPPTFIQAVLPEASYAPIEAASPNPYITYHPVHAGTTIHLPPPQTPDGESHPAFLDYQTIISPSFITTVRQGRVWVDSYTRAIFTPDNQAIADASTGNTALIASSEKLPPPTECSGTLACLNIRSSHNYFHWMYDLLARLELLEAANIPLHQIDTFLVNRCQFPFQRELLQLMGIPNEKIFDPPIFHGIADTLIVPVSSFARGRITQQTCEYLRRKILPLVPIDGTNRPHRLYISRQSAHYRKVVNEAEILALLQPLGFQCVWLEQLSVQAQIALFANAEAIVAPHGAGLSNLIFAQAGTTLIEIFMPDEIVDYYWLLSHHAGIQYHYLIADLTEPFLQSVDSNNLISRQATMTNMIVPVEDLQTVLKFAGIDSTA